MNEVGISDGLKKFFNDAYKKHYEDLKETVGAYERVIDSLSNGLPYDVEDLKFFPNASFLEHETIESLTYLKDSFALECECYEKVGSLEIAPEKYIGDKRIIVEGIRKKQEDLYKKSRGLVS